MMLFCLCMTEYMLSIVLSRHNQLFSRWTLLSLLLPQERELGVNAYLSTRDFEEYGERTRSSLLYLTLQALGQCMSMQ